MSAAETVRAALAATAAGDAAAVQELYAPDVTGWVAGAEIRDRQELLDEVSGRDGALSDIRVETDPVDMPGGGVAAEWRLTARHTSPLRLGDELTVEATGRRVELRGAMFAEVAGGRITAFRQYWDTADLLEQLGLLDEEPAAQETPSR